MRDILNHARALERDTIKEAQGTDGLHDGGPGYLFLLDKKELVDADLLGAKMRGGGPKMLGEIRDTVQIRAHGMRRVVPKLQVFPHALAEWGHGLAPRRHTSTPSGQKGEHGGVTRESHHPRRSHCGPDSGPRRDAGHEGGDGQTGRPYYPNAVSGFVQVDLMSRRASGLGLLAGDRGQEQDRGMRSWRQRWSGSAAVAMPGGWLV